MKEQFLPVGIQNFEQMIEGNFLYVDKTRYIHDMVRPPQGFYFLSRPRRFGKSLTVSTFDYLFRGRKDLFENLHIADTSWQWKPYPIVKFDFSTISFSTSEELEKSLLFHLHRIGTEHGIDNSVHSLTECFTVTIIELYKKYQEKVVVLIDEYDKSIIDHLGRGKDHLAVATENRDILKRLFGIMKGGDVSEALRFVFITGISKFARVSIFSDLNNLNDISMHPQFGDVLGYTHEELITFFTPCIDRLSRELNTERKELIETIRKWYDGYKFTARSESVYNPFSIVRLFEANEFENYWFETGTPTFLLNLILEKQYPVTNIENLKLPKELFSVYELERLQLEPLLFQTGYITIEKFENELYHMRYPNKEVRISFLSYLLNNFSRPENTSMAGVYKLLHIYLKEMKMDDFIEGACSILASIPYPEIAGRDEAYYHSVFYLMLSASGAMVHPEVLSSKGRMDIVIEFDDKVFIIELKCDHSSDMAIRQIIKKKYYEKYMHTNREIYLMGINFDREKRSIDDWQCKPLAEVVS
ncbi:AAA family ATPase [Desulfobacterales bacterium HSG16]|nr:AAA family ATPase [Desulfobacterales bacterium HSG16]